MYTLSEALKFLDMNMSESERPSTSAQIDTMLTTPPSEQVSHCEPATPLESTFKSEPVTPVENESFAELATPLENISNLESPTFHDSSEYCDTKPYSESARELAAPVIETATHSQCTAEVNAVFTIHN